MGKVKRDQVETPTVEPEYVVPPVYDEDGVQATSGIDAEGKEHPDPFPTAPPVGYQPPPDLYWMIRNMVRSEELRRVADNEGFDTFEEAEDFDIDDGEIEVRTEYEKVFDPPPPVPEPIKQGEGGNGGAVPPAPPTPASKLDVSPDPVSGKLVDAGSSGSGGVPYATQAPAQAALRPGGS